MSSLRTSLELALILINTFGMCTYNSGPTSQGQYNVQTGYPVAPTYPVGQTFYPNPISVPNKTYASTYNPSIPNSKPNYFTDGLRQPSVAQQSTLYPQKTSYNNNGNSAYTYSVQKPPTVLLIDPYSGNQQQPPVGPPAPQSPNNYKVEETTTPPSGFWKFLQFFTLPKFEWPTATTSTPPTTVSYVGNNNRYPVGPISNSQVPQQQSFSAINPNYYQPAYQPYPLTNTQTGPIPSSYNTNNYYQTTAQHPQGLYQVLPPNSKTKYTQPQPPLPMRFIYPQQPPKSYSYTNQTPTPISPYTQTSTPRATTTTTTTTTVVPPPLYPSISPKLNYPQSPQNTYSLYLVPSKSYESQQPTNSYVQNYHNPIFPNNQQPYSGYGQPQQQYTLPKQSFQPLLRPQQASYIQDNVRYDYGYPAQPFYPAPATLTHLPPYYPAYVITPASSTTEKPDCRNNTVNSTSGETTTTSSPKPVVTVNPPTTGGVYVAYTTTTAAPTTLTTTTTTAIPTSVGYKSTTSTTAVIDNATTSAYTSRPLARRLFSSSDPWVPLL